VCEYFVKRNGMLSCINMRKRPFILVELLVCIAILSLCVIPFLSYPYFTYRDRKRCLLEIEKQLQTELLFYDLLKRIDKEYTWDQINRKSSQLRGEKTLLVNIDGLGNIPLKVHYHLYHYHSDKRKGSHPLTHKKIWCVFCFETAKEKCPSMTKGKKPKDSPYAFVFYAKKE